MTRSSDFGRVLPDGWSEHRAETGQHHGVPEAPGEQVGRGEEEEREVKDRPEGELGQSPVSPVIFLLDSLGYGAECVPDSAGPHRLQGEHTEDPPSLPLHCWLHKFVTN